MVFDESILRVCCLRLYVLVYFLFHLYVCGAVALLESVSTLIVEGEQFSSRVFVQLSACSCVVSVV